ncbi:MAG TPA: GAF domain-containing SpoIIE family protein phosphatase [Streptosporangiaceae bacterium]
MPQTSPIAGDGKPALPRRHEPDLAGLATFIVDGGGRVTSWPATAAGQFGLAAAEVTGRDVCDVLMTGPGQRDLVRHALAEAAAGQIWSATVAGGLLGDGRFAMRWEPLPMPSGHVLVIAQPLWPQPTPGWLTEATARIGSTLDLTRTANELAEAAVSGFADGVVIYVAERLLTGDEPASAKADQGTAVRRLAARLSDQPPAVTNDLLRPGEVIVLGPDTHGCRAMATAEPVVSSQLDQESAERFARYRSAGEITASYTSFLAVPLIARGMVVGCAVFSRVPASPAFSPDDTTLAGELASRAAVGIDNARLYNRERRAALALQRGLLPGQPEVPSGLEVAHSYLPVGDNVVGGDWYDIVPQSGGRAALIVGDAMGHGPEAAAVMGQLRTVAHTLADLELPPEQLLSKLDHTAATMTTAPFATCVYTTIDPAGNSIVATLAGHLPPVVVLPGGGTRLLELPTGLPLGLPPGIGPGSFKATEFALAPGETLALYTDGLVESRTQPIDHGMAALREALAETLAKPGITLNNACQTVIQLMSEHGEDDITLVLARIRR